MSKPDEKKPAAASTSTGLNPAPQTLPASVIDCSQAEKRLWLVKVPKYLADKWNNAPEDTDVGSIRITTKTDASCSQKPEVLFHLNQALVDKSDESKVPIVHKFEMGRAQGPRLGDQTIYILKQGEEGGKETLATIGKVVERPECTPIRDDKGYLSLKRKAIAKAQEPKHRIITIEPVMNSFMPKVSIKNEKEDKTKKLRKNKDEVMSMLFEAFTKHQYYNIRDLERITQQPISYLKEILHEICRINGKGIHKNTWELKPEYQNKS